MQKKRLDWKDMFNFKISYVTTWLTRNYNTHIALYLTTQKLGLVKEYNKINIFLQKSCRKEGRETSSRPLFVFKKALFEVNASGLKLISNQFRYPST